MHQQLNLLLKANTKDAAEEEFDCCLEAVGDST